MCTWLRSQTSGLWRLKVRIGRCNRGTHALIVQSSQFSGGFDCSIKSEGGGRDVRRSGDWLTEPPRTSVASSMADCAEPPHQTSYRAEAQEAKQALKCANASASEALAPAWHKKSTSKSRRCAGSSLSPRPGTQGTREVMK
eukprot:3918475-Amphidinium_carterae.1